MQLRRIRIEEVENAVDMYYRSNIADTTKYPAVDRDRYISNAITLFNSSAVFDVVEDNGKVVAWIAAIEGYPFLHSSDKVLSQVYCFSDATGIRAVRVMKLLHDGLINHARNRGIKWVKSGSILENYLSFNRVLSSFGWSIVGPVALVQVQPSAGYQEGTRIGRSAPLVSG